MDKQRGIDRENKRYVNLPCFALSLPFGLLPHALICLAFELYFGLPYALPHALPYALICLALPLAYALWL